MLGCSMFQDAVTPTYIEPDAIKYTGELATSFMPYTTLWDAERINDRLDYTHDVKQTMYSRLSEDDVKKYNFLKDKGTLHIQGAKEFQKIVFSPEGPIGLLLPALFGTTIGAMFIKRPRERELEKQLNGGSK